MSPPNRRQQEDIARRNDRQAAENAERRKQHERLKDKFFDSVAERMEPIVYDQLRKEGQIRKHF